jgi:hypothetical protein
MNNALFAFRRLMATAKSRALTSVIASLICVSPCFAKRQMEAIDRGVVAIHQGEGKVFVSWRSLGSEPADVGYNLYRQQGDQEAVKVNATPLTGATNFVDSGVDLSQATRYFVRAIIEGVEQEKGRPFELPANSPARPYLAIPLQTPEDYHANDASVGDLDGDGQYEIVVHMVGRGRDNSQSGFTTEPILHAYKLDGTRLWEINLGKNIREGAHYTQFMVYDLDGDGRAEVVCKTADGTVDGVGKVIGDPHADHRQQPPPQTPVQPESRGQAGANIPAHFVQVEQANEESTDAEEPAARDRDRDRRRVEGARDDENGDENEDQARERRRERWRRYGRGGRRGQGRQRGPRFGYVLKGPEFLTVFNGETGAAMSTVEYVPQRHPDTNSPTPEQMLELWGDAYGNRIDRFLAGIAYLDGERPSVVMCRGYYTRTVIAAWDWRDGKLTQRWVFDSDKADATRGPWRGQGFHSLSVADVDNDGRDEILYGSMVIDDDGTGLYSTGLGHGDAQHTTDLDPSRPGLETWSIHEHPPQERAGVDLRDSRTGELIFTAANGVDVGRGMASDIDPRYPGCELWGGTRNLFDAQGKDIGARPRSQNMAIWWDGDLLRELLDGVTISKWDYEKGEQQRIFDGRAEGVAANNGSKSNPCLAADILGDWREELVARTPDSKELRIYTTTIPTEHRLPTLMHDPVYRLAIAWQNVGYNQPPHTSFFLGDGMAAPPRPEIDFIEPVQK